MSFTYKYLKEDNIIIVQPLDTVDFDLCLEMLKSLNPFLYENETTSFFFDYYTYKAALISYDDLKLLTEYFKTFTEHLNNRKLAFYTVHENHKQNLKSWIAMLTPYLKNKNIQYFDDLQKVSAWLNYDVSYLYNNINQNN